MSIDEQIDNLKGKGLIIKNEEYAWDILNDISYFRLKRMPAHSRTQSVLELGGNLKKAKHFEFTVGKKKPAPNLL